MKYSKPEVLVQEVALRAVLGTTKETTHIVDKEFEVTSPGAYEADE